MKRRIFSVVTALTMVVTVSILLPISAAKADETAEPELSLAETGTYGELEYEVSEDGTVTITGYDNSLASVEIPETIDGRTVTTIGDKAFYECSSLSSISLPESVNRIGDLAFMGCDNLIDINIPDGVRSIGYYAFKNCASLTSVSLAENVISIGYLAFNGCNSLNKIEVSDDNTNYSSDEGVLFNKDKTELILCPCYKSGDYIVPDGVINIDEYAFEGCKKLTSISLPDSVSNIDIGAFSGCSSMTSVKNIPDKITTIANYMFVGCSSLSNIELPNNLEIIGLMAFGECSSLEFVSLPDGLIKICASAFESCSALTSIYIPSSVDTINSGAFSRCDALENVFIYDIAKWCEIDFGDMLSNPLFYAETMYLYDEPISELIIPSDVTVISDYSFYKYNGTSVVLPENIITIGDKAFGGCDALMDISIPDSVTNIGKSAFEYCSSLKSISIGSGVTYIGSYAFENCNSLSDIYYNGSLSDFKMIYSSFDSLDVTLHCSDKTYIDWGTCGDDLTWTIDNTGTLTIIGTGTMKDYAGYPNSARSPFYDNESITSVVIEDGVTAIGERAFEDCSALNSVTIPKSVTTIGNYAFSGCYELDNIYYMSDISQWCSIVFCSALSNPMYYEGTLYVNNNLVTEINIPDGVTAIGNYVFYGCSDLKSITIPDSVTSIGDYAFSRCSGLISCTIPDTVTSITDGLFMNCSALKSVTIPDSLKTIGDYAFYNCSSLASISLPDGVTSIGKYAFFDCVELTNLVISPSVTEIGSNAYGLYDYNDFYNDGKGYISYPVTLYGLPDSVAETYAYESNNSKYEYTRTEITFIAYDLTDNCASIQYCTPYKNGSRGATILNNIDGKPLTEIAVDAFSTCTELTDVYFEGTEEEWNALTIQSGNDCLLNAELHFNSIQPSPMEADTFICDIAVSETENVYSFNIELAYPHNSSIIAIIYSNGEIAGQTTAPLSPFDTSVELNVDAQGDTAKIFIWDDFQSMIPLCPAESIDL